MIKVNEIAFAAYPVTDKQRARDFYERLVGLKPTMDSVSPEGYWIEYDIGTGTLAKTRQTGVQALALLH
jgi:catechol 2,3-dioxygenase-like lactoylglutathione lyase family enzyme